MIKYKNYLGFLLLAISLTVSGQSDLDSYLKIAAENNPGIRARFNDYMSALEVAPQVKALPDPQIAFAYFISPIETRMGPQEFKFSASQMFPWFGTQKAKENIAIESAKAKFEIFQEAISKLNNNVTSVYLNIYLNRKAIGIITENLKILYTFQQLVSVKVESGKTSNLDEYRLEMEIGELENQLALLKDKEIVLKVEFFNLLNDRSLTSVSTPDELPDKTILLTKEQISDSIMINNHQILSLNLQQEALTYQKELAINEGKPDFSIGFDYTVVGRGESNLDGTDAFMFPKIGVTLPLYRSKYRAMVNQIIYQQEAKESELSNRQNILNSLFENVWYQYKNAEREIALYTSQLNLAALSITLLESEYSTGNADFEEILRMERKLLKYSLELEKSKTDKQAAISYINYLTGK